MQRPPMKTLVVYQVDILGKPKERIAAKRNRASNAAKPLRRLENEAPLLRPPLKSNRIDVKKLN